VTCARIHLLFYYAELSLLFVFQSISLRAKENTELAGEIWRQNHIEL